MVECYRLVCRLRIFLYLQFVSVTEAYDNYGGVLSPCL